MPPMHVSSYHIYSLPAPLLQSLTPRTHIYQQPDKPDTPPPEPAISSINAGLRTCNICLQATFPDVDEQRAHFRSDWHRYNVKTRLGGGKTVNEAEFAQLVDALEDSISGSATSSSENEDDSDSDAVNTLISRRKPLERAESPDQDTHTLPRTAICWFHSPPSTQIGVYKSLFPSQTPESEYLSALQDLQVPQPTGRTWAMFMVAGGHFSGAIVRVAHPAGEDTDTEPKPGKQKRSKPETEVLRHKAIHRYTTRRKQGGSQGLNDNAKGNAKSAGAQLRRYGEQSLREDIQTLLQEWEDELNDCELIWLRASGANRKIFVGYEGAVISKSDERLRGFPFPTRRPTQSELARCLLELTRAKASHFTEEELRTQDELYLASLPKRKVVPTIPTTAAPQEKPSRPKLTQDEEILRDKWSRLLGMIVKGRLEPLKAFWDREGLNLGGINVAIPDWIGEKRRTLLQVASEADREEIVKWLLEDQRADPTIVVPVTVSGEAEEPDTGNNSDLEPVTKHANRTAYDLARSKAVRDTFRRCAALNPDWWDWLGAGHIPSALSKEMEDDRDEKKKVRRKGLKDRVKAREGQETSKDAVETVAVPALPISHSRKDPTAPQKLGGTSGATDGIAGLTPEMRAKVERERRARAAEARLRTIAS